MNEKKLTKKAMLEEMKETKYIERDRCTSALWYGNVRKSYVEHIYSTYLESGWKNRH